MQSGQWIGLSALAAAIVAIGLGIGALVLALDEDEPAFVLGGGRLPSGSAGPGESGFQREGEARRVPLPDLEGFGGSWRGGCRRPEGRCWASVFRTARGAAR